MPHGSRSTGSGGARSLACEMLIAIDEPLYAHMGRDLRNATDLAVDMVNRLNDIYHRTILRDDTVLGQIYFHVKEVRVLFDFCTECNSTQRVYLSEFSQMDFSDFCLAHVFTYRDFPEGVQGLAWKATICSGKYNTGFTTLLNHQVTNLKQHSIEELHDSMLDYHHFSQLKTLNT
jgi:disintegrin and metalloproteinase domain-containing protein 17